jgi:hypothetical protein
MPATKSLIQSVALLMALAFFSCTKPNTLSEVEKKEGWVLLFDGKTTQGWHLFNQPTVSTAWDVVNGELTSDTNEKKGVRGDIVTDSVYENFDLVFEWKIAKEGNSGVFINVKEDTAYMATWATGPEYQLLDNANMAADYLKNGKKSAGCIYGVAPLQNKTDPKPFGEWNQSRIFQQNGQIRFWLNGVLTGQEEINSAGWKSLIAESSLKIFPDFGKATKGHIGLQDWAKGVSFRNIKIKSFK